MKLRQGKSSTSAHEFGASVDLDQSLSVLKSLQKNKSGLQIILHLLAEWNNIEIQLICDRKNLLADVTLLWTKIANVDNGLETLWRQLVMNLRDELTTKWKQAMSLKEEYEKVLDQTLSHLKTESLPDEQPLSTALKEHQKAQAAAQKLYQKGQVRDQFVDNRNSDRSNRSGNLTRKNSWRSSPDAQSEKIEKADVNYRRRNAHLNSMRQSFVEQAMKTYPGLIEEQHDIATSVRKCLKRHTMAASTTAGEVAISSAKLSSITSKFSPFRLTSPLQDLLDWDLTRLPRYRHVPYVDPRDGEVRQRVLWGIDVTEESCLENGALLVLLNSMRGEGKSTLAYARKRSLTDDTAATATFLETYWHSSPEENLAIVSRRPFDLRHSLILFYLSHLPSPLLPLSNNAFTQYALKKLSLRQILKSVHPSNMILLQELCSYIGTLAEHDPGVVRQFSKLVLRANSDLMGEASNEKTIEGLMGILISHFRKERERKVLDIRSPTPSSPDMPRSG